MRFGVSGMDGGLMAWWCIMWGHVTRTTVPRYHLFENRLLNGPYWGLYEPLAN